MAKKKTSQKNKSGRTPKGKSLSTDAKFRLLAHRVHALEAAAPAPRPAAPRAVAAAGPADQSIQFTLSNATATVRMSLVDNPAQPEVVLMPGQTSGSSAPRPNNTQIDAIVELSGSAGDSAEIDMTNTDTPKIKPTIPNSFVGGWYPIQYTLKTKW
jgi:hypothetical protein